MREKNIFLYEFFFVIKYFRFQFIFYVKLHLPPPPPPLKKVTLLFPTKLPLKVEVLSSPPSPTFLKLWWEVQPPLSNREGGTHYDVLISITDQYVEQNQIFLIKNLLLGDVLQKKVFLKFLLRFQTLTVLHHKQN